MTIKDGRGWLTFAGILSIICGIAAMGSPLLVGAMVTRIVTVIIGIFLLIGGGSELIHAFSTKGWQNSLFALLGGLLALIAGVLVMAHPLFGMKVLALILIFYFLTDGSARILLALNMRPVQGWGFVLFGGIISLMLGIMLWQGWPLSGIWAIGVMLGIRMLFSGINLLALRAACPTAESA